MTFVHLLGALALALCASCHSAPQPAGRFEQTMASEVSGQRLSYLVDIPSATGAPRQGWPLLLFLHGAGERGGDLAQVTVHGPPKLRESIPELSRCVLLTPLCPAESWWQAKTLRALLDEVIGTADVDTSRIYVTGLSMGGYGTWALLSSYPDFFAAAVPICGGGDAPWTLGDSETGFDLEGLKQAQDVPIRVFHGDADGVIPVEESETLVHALREVGGDVGLTVYPGVGHDSWTRTYADQALYVWLFEQRRTNH